MPKAAYFDYVIIGGGIAGISAAEAIRSVDSSGTILVVSKETERLYSRVLLPAYIRGTIQRERVFLRSLDDFAKRSIELALGIYVVGVHLDEKEIVTSDDQRIQFKKLLIAAGGTPHAWSAGGLEPDDVIHLQTLADADRVRETFLKGQEEGIVIGGGFISLEFIESAVKYGSRVHLILRGRKMFGEQLDDLGWQMIEKNLERNGVTMYPEVEVQQFGKDEAGLLSVVTNKAQVVRGSWLGVGVGIERNYSIFQGSGIEVRRGIVVDQYLQTAREDVWAAGDVSEFYDVIFGEHRVAGNWTTAFLQGKQAGLNMAAHSKEQRKEFRGLTTYSITSLGYNLTFVGKTEKKDGMEDIVRLWPENAGYERLFIENGKIVGAVLIGRFQDKVILAKLIESGADITPFKKALSDHAFEISHITHQVSST